MGTRLVVMVVFVEDVHCYSMVAVDAVDALREGVAVERW